MKASRSEVLRLIRYNRPEYFGAVILANYAELFPPREWFKTQNSYEHWVRITTEYLRQELIDAKSQERIEDPSAILARVEDKVTDEVFGRKKAAEGVQPADTARGRGDYCSPIDFGNDVTE